MSDNLPPLINHVGKRGRQKLPDMSFRYYRVTGEIYVPQTGMPEKQFCLQRIEFEKDNRIELRLGYYIIGKRPGMRGRWTWGQFARFLPLDDFTAIIQKAKDVGWI
jgi:hypothetical protein